jgi:Holliday junction resolvase RusA-like endonuclease
MALMYFRVNGLPAPGGSKNIFVNPKTGRINVADAGKNNKSWRNDVALAAKAAGLKPSVEPLSVVCIIYVKRPISHYRANGELKVWAVELFPTGKPDATKLWRSTEDALKDIAWVDDAQVVRQLVEKRYGPVPGAAIWIEEIIKDGTRGQATNAAESA